MERSDEENGNQDPAVYVRGGRPWTGRVVARIEVRRSTVTEFDASQSVWQVGPYGRRHALEIGGTGLSSAP